MELGIGFNNRKTLLDPPEQLGKGLGRQRLCNRAWRICALPRLDDWILPGANDKQLAIGHSQKRRCRDRRLPHPRRKNKK